MARKPLSSVPEEACYLRADDRCHAIGKRLGPLLHARLEAHARGLDRSALSLAASNRSASAARLAMDRKAAGIEWAHVLVPPEQPVQKAKKKPTGATEAELIDQAVETGIDLGLETLPADIRDEVDIAAATRLARQRLTQGMFRQSLAALDESMRGIETLVEADLERMDLALLRNPDRLASLFGLNKRQASALLSEANRMLANGVKRLVIERQLLRRVKQAVQARAEMIGQSLANEAINTAQQALYDTARAQGLLDPKMVREWVTRRDNRVCPRCDAFDGERAAIDGYFTSDIGEIAFEPGIHPACRCRTRLVASRSTKRGKRAA